MKGKDFLRISDVSADGLRSLLDLAARMKADRSHLAGSLAGRSIALLFEKPSLRTKASFSVGAVRLGMTAVSFASDEIGLGVRESLEDGARALGRFFDLLVYRTFEQQRLTELALHCPVPVVNGLTDHEHPCQALADFLTLRERLGKVEGARIAWIGDGNNVCHSLTVAAALLGARMAIATPPSRPPNASVIAQARALGGDVELGHDPHAAAAGADAIVTDTWTSMGREGEAELRRQEFAGFTVDAALMARARPGAVFLHCLPAHRGEEVTADVIESPASAVFDEAENRMHVQVALMARLLGAA